MLFFKWTPHPCMIVTTRDDRDDVRVLLYSQYTTITGWGPHKLLYRPTGDLRPQIFAALRSESWSPRIAPVPGRVAVVVVITVVIDRMRPWKGRWGFGGGGG